MDCESFSPPFLSELKFFVPGAVAFLMVTNSIPLIAFWLLNVLPSGTCVNSIVFCFHWWFMNHTSSAHPESQHNIKTKMASVRCNSTTQMSTICRLIDFSVVSKKGQALLFLLSQVYCVRLMLVYNTVYVSTQFEHSPILNDVINQ